MNCVSREFAVVIRPVVGEKMARPDFRLNHGRAFTSSGRCFSARGAGVRGVTAGVALAPPRRAHSDIQCAETQQHPDKGEKAPAA